MASLYSTLFKKESAVHCSAKTPQDVQLLELVEPGQPVAETAAFHSDFIRSALPGGAREVT